MYARIDIGDRPKSQRGEPSSSDTKYKPLSRSQALDALRTWRDAKIEDLRNLYFNGERFLHGPAFAYPPPNEHPRAICKAPTAAGLAVTQHHPAVANLISAFSDECRLVIAAETAFSQGDLDWMPDAPTALAIHPPRMVQITPRLREFSTRWIESGRVRATELNDATNIVRRLAEFTGGDPMLHEIDTDLLDRFVARLRHFPRCQRPNVRALTFNQILDRFAHQHDYSAISAVTVHKLSLLLGRLFSYARDLRLLTDNPMVGAVPPRGETVVRQIYTPADLRLIFSRPLFTGFHGDGRSGYRDTPGDTLLKDAKFWLPILALYQGARMDEIGAAFASEVRRDEETGIWGLDLTGRPVTGVRRVKNRESQRFVPLHPKAVALGFVDFALARPKAPRTMLFDGFDLATLGARRSVTHGYSQWFGRWIDHITARGEGAALAPGKKDFHSFRHTFKRACRDAQISEEVHDALTGHKGAASVGRSYGRGMSVTTMAEALARVTYPTIAI